MSGLLLNEKKVEIQGRKRPGTEKTGTHVILSQAVQPQGY